MRWLPILALVLPWSGWVQGQDCRLSDSLRTRAVSHGTAAGAGRQALAALPFQPENISRVRLADQTTLRCVARTQRVVVCPGQNGDVQFTLRVTYGIEIRATDSTVVYQVAPNVVYTDGKRLQRVQTPQGRQLRPVGPVEPADRKAIQCAFEAAQPYYQRIASQMACALRQRLQAYLPAGAY